MINVHFEGKNRNGRLDQLQSHISSYALTEKYDRSVLIVQQFDAKCAERVVVCSRGFMARFNVLHLKFSEAK